MPAAVPVSERIGAPTTRSVPVHAGIGSTAATPSLAFVADR
ncbi:hypothetical protein [Labedella populi]|nr:hypothetical protein [Labedella populi]